MLMSARKFGGCQKQPAVPPKGVKEVRHANATTFTAKYAYLPNSRLVGTVASTNNATGKGMLLSRTWDRLNRLTTIQAQGFPTAAAGHPIGFTYQYNDANQRTRADLADGTYWVYQYDALGQVISGRRHWDDGTLVAGQDFDYAFDDIGNRDKTGGRASAVSDYSNNHLNQYTQRTVPTKLDILGLANPTAGVQVWKDSDSPSTASRRGEYFHHALTVANGTYPLVTAKSLYGATETTTLGRSFVPPATETFGYDSDGNLTSDGRWTAYVWDGENRLVEMRRDTSTPTEARQKLTFEYDHLGRRIRKILFTHNGTNWVEQRDTLYLYDGWNLVAEFDKNNSNATLRTYVWGTDLSGSMTGAGGVGGLLWVNNSQTTGGLPTGIQFVAYDGNGNVGGLIAASDGSSTARYEYGPFGEPLRATGALAGANPIRWSTKVTDDEGGLVYYGYRYYNPGTGRWLNRDPIEERGGLNVIGFVSGNAVSFVDVLGLQNPAPIIPDLPPVVRPPGNIIPFPGPGPTPVPPPGSPPGEIVPFPTPSPQPITRPIGLPQVTACVAVAIAGYKLGQVIDESQGGYISEFWAEAAVDCAEAIKDKCDRRKCRPCIPPVGTIAYRVDRPPSPPHNGIPTPHSHRYQMRQSPPKAGCRCFWKKLDKDPFPGELTPEMRPAAGGGIAP
jgi:RHS repeat-associated protein